jgi:LysR family transcriptional regulator, low CO2-responsive transcriptional regulator
VKAMRYSQWRAFDAVAREASFSKAAARLGITQPAVTLQIKALETACAVPLFRRDGRSIALTDAGRTLLGLTRRMFAVEDEMREFVSAASALEGGTVVLAADGPHVALELVARFQKRHPSVKVKISFGNSSTVWKELIEEKVDAAVIANPSRHQSVCSIPLARKSMVALMPRHHRLAARRSIRLRDLQDEPLIMRESGSNTRRTLQRAFRKEGVRPRSMLEVGSREAVCEAVAMDLGIGFVFEREFGNAARTVALPLKGLEASNLDTLTFRRADAERTLVKALIRTAADVAAEA